MAKKRKIRKFLRRKRAQEESGTNSVEEQKAQEEVEETKKETSWVPKLRNVVSKKTKKK